MKNIAAVALGIFLIAPVQAQTPVPVGNQFQVNTYTPDNQEAPAVSATAPGEFVVTWRSLRYRSFPHSHAVYLQRFSDDGTPLGLERHIDDAYFVGKIDVASNSEHFLVVWDTCGRYYCGNIHLQAFEVGGAPLGGNEIYQYYGGYSPAVSNLSSSQFIVVWSWGAQLVSSDGTELGSPFGLSAPVGSRFTYDVAATRGDTFTAVWRHQTPIWDEPGPLPSSYEYSIRGGRYEPNGTPVGESFQVNSYVLHEDSSALPRIVSKENGSSLITWQNLFSSPGTDTEYGSIIATRLSSDGQILGQDFQVNSCTSASQRFARAASTGLGDYVVVWQSGGDCVGDPTRGVSGQRVSIDGELIGSEFLVNAYTTTWQGRPDAAYLGNGQFVVTWDSVGSYGSDTDGASIQARLFEFPDYVFTDGFESGDTAAWSSTQ